MGKWIKLTFKHLFQDKLSPKIAIYYISVISVIYFAFNHRVIATAMPLSLAGYKFFQAIGIDIAGLFANTPSQLVSLRESIHQSFLDNPTLVLILGYCIGVLIVSLSRDEFKFTKIKNKYIFWMMVLGGLLCGFGVQGIYGANIGEVYGAISMLSLSGWIIIPCVLIGIFLAKPVYMWFIKK